MRKFYDGGRIRELNSLERLYKSNEFTFAVVYGRRRIGKTCLINEFINRGDKKAIRFTATKGTDAENREIFSHRIFKTLYPDIGSYGIFPSWNSAFEFVAEESKKGKLIIFIDEFPYLADARPAISSELQVFIDTMLLDTDAMLILCGSSMSFMENQVLGYQSPLYGRRTAQYKIMPLDYYDSAEFLANANTKDKLLSYAVTGGVPLYLNIISKEDTVVDGIKNAFFATDGFMYEEPYNLLKQELREPAVYNTIIGAIASGATELKVIADKVKEDKSKVAKYITSLTNLGILKREVPMFAKSDSKGVYRVADNMYRFWYRFVRKEIPAIESGRTRIFETNVEPFITDFMGPVFEEICMQYLMRLDRAERLPFEIDRIGRWWGSNPATKKHTEVDAIASSADDKKIIMCECKWKNEVTGWNAYNSLTERSVLFPGKEIHYYMFSRSGFEDELKEEAERNRRLTLVELDDLFKV